MPGNPFEAAERILQRQGISYQQGNRHNYLWQFARLCNRYGVSRQDCQAYADTVYGYDEKTNWIDSYRKYGSETEMYCQNGYSTNLQNQQRQADQERQKVILDLASRFAGTEATQEDILLLASPYMKATGKTKEEDQAKQQKLLGGIPPK